MNRIAFILFAVVAILSCADEHEINSELTGNKISYPLVKSSAFDISGTVTIFEKKDGLARIEVALSGLSGTKLQLPVHLHHGAVNVPDALVAAILNPVNIETGKSTTDLVKLSDETPVSFRDFSGFAGSVKIHLAEAGEGRKTILAAGNIGSLYTPGADLNSIEVSVCQSNP